MGSLHEGSYFFGSMLGGPDSWKLPVLQAYNDRQKLGSSQLSCEALAVDSKDLEYEPWTTYAGDPSSLGFGVEGQSYSNFLASNVRDRLQPTPKHKHPEVGKIWGIQGRYHGSFKQYHLSTYSRVAICTGCYNSFRASWGLQSLGVAFVSGSCTNHPFHPTRPDPSNALCEKTAAWGFRLGSPTEK